MTAPEERLPAKTIWDFIAEFLVVCPGCGSLAVVAGRTPTTPPRFACSHCGRNKTWPEQFRSPSGDAASAAQQGVMLLGAPVDAYFHLPLWLTTPCAGHTLWAYNRAHLAYLRTCVAANLRRKPLMEDGRPPANQSNQLANRLPKWLLSAKNRAQVLAAIAKLERKLDQP